MGVDLAKVGNECRSPGDHIWVNPVDGDISSDSIYWTAVNLDYEKTNDPSVSCVLSKLEAPKEILERIKSVKTPSEEFSATWGNFQISWQGIMVGKDLEGFVRVFLEKTTS